MVTTLGMAHAAFRMLETYGDVLGFLPRTLKPPPSYLPCRDEVVAAIRKCTERLATTPWAARQWAPNLHRCCPPVCLPAMIC